MPHLWKKSSFLLLNKMERNFKNNTGKNDITKFRDLGLYIENAKFLLFKISFTVKSVRNQVLKQLSGGILE